MYKCINVLKHRTYECIKTFEKRLDNVAISGDCVIQPFIFLLAQVLKPSIFYSELSTGPLISGSKNFRERGCIVDNFLNIL